MNRSAAKCASFLMAACLCAMIADPVRALDWPQWLGPVIAAQRLRKDEFTSWTVSGPWTLTASRGDRRATAFPATSGSCA